MKTAYARHCSHPSVAFALLAVSILACLVLGTIRPAWALADPQALVARNTQLAGVLPQGPTSSSQVYLPLVFANPLAQAQFITPEYGGKVGLPGGEVTLSVPAGAVSAPVHLSIQIAGITNPSGASRLGQVVEVSAVDESGASVSQLLRPATLEFRFQSDDLAYFSASSLGVRSRSGAGGWEGLLTQVDVAHQRATANTTHFSSFGLFGPSIVSTKSYGLTKNGGGNLYYLADYNGASGVRTGLWMRPPGSDQGTLTCPLDWLSGYANEWTDLDRDPGSGDIFIAVRRQVYRLTMDCTLTQIMSVPDYAQEYHGIYFSPYYHDLFVIHSGAIIQADPANGAEIRRLGDAWSSFIWSDAVTDSQGRVFAIGRSQTNLDPEFSDLVWWTDPDQPGVHSERGGFIGGRRMAIDGQDNLFVANLAGNAISILELGEMTVRSYVSVNQPSALVVSGSTVLAASNGYVAAFPGNLPAPASRGASLTPADTLSGNNGLVTVTTNQAGVIPAHYTFRLGSQILANIGAYDSANGSFSYALSGTFLESARPQPYQAPPAGLYRLSLTGQTLAAGEMRVPGATFVQPAIMQDGYVQHLARGEWLSWIYRATKVESLEGLFPSWEQGSGSPFLIYQFNQVGEYHFRMDDYSSSNLNLTVIVSAEGQPSEPGYGRILEYTIDPAQGLRIWYSGAVIEIPDGALPGTDPYTLKLTIWNQPNPSLDAITASSYRYQLEWLPEPTQLEKPIRLSLPYDANSAGGTPQGVYLDPEVQDMVDLNAQVSTGAITLSFPVGTYGEAAPALVASPNTVPAGQNPAAPEVSWGSLNRLGKSLWWVVGLPNEKVFDDQFTILYNTGDAGESYALKLLEALQTARAAFDGTYTMPTNKIIVKIAPWVTSGSRPGATTSLLFNYHIFFNNTLGDDELEATAAHEFFHVLQRKNTTVEGYLLAPSWFLESTATWAEYKVFPQNTTYLSSIGGNLDFPNYSFDQWGSMAVEKQYATMAFFEYLEQKKGSGAVKKVLDELNNGKGFWLAVHTVTGGLGKFYGDFAKDYWMQNFEPVSGWNLDSAFTNVELSQAENALLNKQMPTLSSGLIKAYWDNVDLPNPPVSFQQASGSVVRLPASCEYSKVYLYNKAKSELGSFLGQVDPGQVISLNKLGDYSGSNGLYSLYINSDVSAACSLSIVWETPTTVQLSPDSVTKGASVNVMINGSGFGDKMGEVVTSAGTFTPIGWRHNYVTFTLPAQDNPGSLNVQVKLPSGELSNPLTLTVNP